MVPLFRDFLYFPIKTCKNWAIREKNIETPSFPLEKTVMSRRIYRIHTHEFKQHVPGLKTRGA